MHDLDSQLLFFRSEIKKIIHKEIKITNEVISNLISNGPFSLSEEEKNFLIKNLESTTVITQKIGSVVTSDHKPWINQLIT